MVQDNFSPLTVFRGSGEQAFFLREYFSVREFDAIDDMLVLPFHRDDTVIGLMIIVRTSVPFEEQEQFLLSEIDRLSVFMYESRELLSGKTGEAVYADDEAIEKTSKLIEKAKAEGKNIVIIRLEITPLVDHLASRLENAEEFRLRKDVLNLISSMISGSGKIICSAADHCILLIESRSLTHGRLLLHQIHHALENHFSLDDAPLPDLSYTERLYPRDGEKAESLLEGLL